MFHYRQIPKTGSDAIKLTAAIIVVFIIILFAVICFYKRKRKYSIMRTQDFQYKMC